MKPVEATPELREFLHGPDNGAFLEFYEYWLRKGAGRAMPARADIDPLDIPQLLANVFLIDVVPGTPRRFRFRLVGTRITELEGEMTTRFLDEFVPGAAGTAMARHYEDTVEGGSICATRPSIGASATTSTTTCCCCRCRAMAGPSTCCWAWRAIRPNKGSERGRHFRPGLC
jgi:PAS domain